MTMLLETASHGTPAEAIAAAIVAAVILFGGLGAVRLFGATRPNA